MIHLREDILKSQIAYYNGKIAKHKQNVEVYLTYPVGIGEHPQHTEEMDNIVTQFADAQDKLEALKMMLSHIGNSKPDPEKQIIKG